jgi:hypothetical protein
MRLEMHREIKYLNFSMVNDLTDVMEVELTLELEIWEGHLEDPKLTEIRQLIRDNKTSEFSEDSQGTLWLGKQICVPNHKHIKELILWEAHDSAYSIHPGSTKVYKDWNTRYWWYGMKRYIAEYVSLCDICQRVKAEHQRPAGLLQWLKILEWIWEEIGIDFIVGLRRTQAGYDSIWVIVDRLTKVAHFIPVKTTYSRARLAELYMSQIVCLHEYQRRSCWAEAPNSPPNFGRSSMSHGRQAEFQLSLSSTDWWSNVKDQPDLRRYGETLHLEVWKKLGQESTLCKILIQQQLPSQHRDGTVWSPIWMIVPNSAVLKSDWRMLGIWT